ncbi:ABC transporter substrate-binding protein [Desulfuribacillus alkaliarsenatis]|uniref:SsuA/THI5-like domain-containing protein n=1 Tax=Desulfuribacillus alkaliarsenatis TaxID=766136 RepID=A0A1E5G303_9FIRM|nr:MqnA/MqnD/SBP family protein [Desulfuribacillus alkaliarsenatis]OEF97455.1 hypothetical protein BHF68_04410 [Desulfuribacillus alkaliarsenatis]
MNLKKKILLSFISIVCIAVLLAACGTAENTTSEKPLTEKPGIQIATLKGPTGMGMVQLIDQQEQGTGAFEYDFELFNSPDALVGKIINGEVDIAAVPTNLALILYNRTEGEVQLAAVNTLGVLYLLENGESIQSLTDLIGKNLSISGKGATPDFITRYLLEYKGLTPERDVMLDYKLEHADLAAALVAGDVESAILPQPHVTTAMARNNQLRIALDINELWEQATGGLRLPMGSIIVQKSYATEHPELVAKFLEEYKQSVDFVNSEHDKAAALIEKHDILPNAVIAKAAIPNSNIVFIDALEARNDLEAYYQVLLEYEPRSIGGSLPDEGFYFNK